MPNIKLNYLYRDAGNYKVYGEVIFLNFETKPLSELESILRSRLIDFEFFDPDTFQIPRLSHKEFPFNPKLDHSWNEFVSLELSLESATSSLTFSEFVQLVK